MGCGDCCGHAAPPSASEQPPGGLLPAGTAEGQLLQWDADTSTWIPVAAPTTEGQIIAWDADTEEWVAQGAPTADGQILVWDAATETWVAGAQSGGGLFSPLDIMAPTEVVAYWRAGTGEVLPTANSVAQWSDLSGNGYHLIQATAANQPQLDPTNGPNGRPALLFDGVNDSLKSSLLDRPAPGTQVTFYWAIMRQVTFTAGDRFWSSEGNSRLALQQSTTAGTPNIAMRNNSEVNTNAGLVLNTYKRVEVAFTNSNADYIKAAATTVTGANAGNIDPLNDFVLGADAALGTFCNMQISELAIFNVVPSAAQIARLDAYAVARYGAVTT